MSGILGIGAGGDTGFYDFPLEQSLRFNDDDQAHLSKLWDSAGNKKTFTISFWFKRGKLSDRKDLVSFAQDVPILIDGDDEIQSFIFGQTRVQTNRKFRDTSAWYHIVLEVDSTQATESDRINFYVNGTKETDLQSESYPSQNLDANIYTSSLNMTIGRTVGGGNYFDGYIAEFHFLDGVRADADQFGETKSGIWVPKQYTGSYGTNGFHLTFEDDTTVEGFNTVLYDGTGATKSVGGVGFEPDLVWIKVRNNTNNHRLMDSVRGAANDLISNDTGTESNTTTRLQSFDSDGFTVGSNAELNSSGHNIVAWCWDAGTGSAASNTDGSITSSVKANTARGFSIVTYTGTGSNATVGHGLGAAPTMIIVKKRTNDTQAWQVYHSGNTANPETDKLTLNTDAATVDDNTTWNDTAPTSTVFSIGTGSGTNESTDTYVAYCWTDISGYSKMGSYTGTGSSGNAITTGFKPAWLMIKRSDGINNWHIVDNTRNADGQINDVLFADSTAVESSGTNNEISTSSTGFTLESGDARTNASSGEYVYMAFADTREYAFWTDQSGNNNDFQHVNLEHMDVVPDRPTNNFCTVNQLSDVSNIVLAEGNLNLTNTVDSWPTVRGTMGVSSGKWYYEVAHSDATRWGAGWATKEFQSGTTFSTNIADSILGYSTDPLQVYDFGTLRSINGTPAFTTSDILQVAIDVDAGKFWLGIDNTWVNDSGGTAGDPAGGSNELETFTAGTEVFPTFVNNRGNLTVNFGQDSTFAGATTAGGNTDENGNGDFKYSVPSGFLALCTDNLPDPGIDPNKGETPDEYFNTRLYQGNSGTQSITGVGFQPDLLWVKNRATAYSHALADVVRGATKSISFNSSAAERTSDITSLDSDGFSLQFVNATGSFSENQGTQNHVSWNWKAGGTAVSNTDGSITSSVSASPESGFSIVSYTGTGSAATIGHGLNAKPQMILVKNRDSTREWLVYNEESGATKYMFVTNNQASSDSSSWNNTEPTSSVFTVGSSASSNNLNEGHVAYCFHSVEGYSKIGVYEGNANANGTFVYTGFRPAWVLFKRIDASASWVILDNKRDVDNPVEHILFHTNAIELSPYDRCDFLSNGFKLRDTGSGVNNSDTILYMAFAEQPFKYANAR